MREPTERVKQVFSDMYELTKGKCATCRAPHTCCNAGNCEDVREFAMNTYGIELESTGHPRLPFMGEDGCVVPPHLRPLCTVHVCEQHFHDEAFEKAYFELREEASEALEEDVLG